MRIFLLILVIERIYYLVKVTSRYFKKIVTEQKLGHIGFYKKLLITRLHFAETL